MRLPAIILLAGAVRLSAATPAVTTFTTSTAAPIQGQPFTLCWAATNAPTSITITPGVAGSGGSYVNTTSPASGCATFMPPQTRLRTDGDSLTCGFRATGAAQNTFRTDLPCSPNPNPNGSVCCAYGAVAVRNLRQLGYSLPVYQNLGIVGATANGHTPVTCTGSVYNPDILAINFGANDLAGSTQNSSGDALLTNLTALWNTASASGCKVVVATVTPRANLNVDSVRIYANGLIRSSASLYSALIDLGGDPIMGCAGCNLTATAYYNTDGTHYTDAGYAREGGLASAAIAPLMMATYTITAANASGTSAAVKIQVSVKSNTNAVLPAGIQVR